MTARDAAIKLIEVYVRRGDSLASLKGSYVGSSGNGDGARIAGDWIIVEWVSGQEVSHRFKLAEIYNHIKSGQASLPLEGSDVQS